MVPATDGTATPAAIRRFSPATRTMKNSSRLLAKIARNLARSSSGTRRVSLARSSTRLLNASQESSRSEKRSAGSSAWLVASLADALCPFDPALRFATAVKSTVSIRFSCMCLALFLVFAGYVRRHGTRGDQPPGPDRL
jgi:hypothetical protein